MLKQTFAVVLAAVCLTGCTFDESYETEEPAESLYQRLGAREALALEPTSLVGVAAYDEDGNALPCLQPTVSGGEAILRTTPEGVLVVEKMTISLTDVVVEPGIVYDAPIHLTDMRLKLGTQLALEPDWTAGDNQASGVGHADLLMDWAVLDSDGDVLPLATQKLRRVEFAVTTRLDENGQVRAEVMSSVDGRIGGFANRIELSDFAMAVKASSDAAAVE